MTQTATRADNPVGTGKYVVKVLLGLVYTVACAVAERISPLQTGQVEIGVVVTAIVAAPLLVCAGLYALWWRRADEFQRLIEYKASSSGALGGVLFLVLIKLAGYFWPAVDHVPSLAVVGMVLLYWVNNSHRLNVRAAMP
ncbi:hypothetical protein ABAC460_01860 [Asticcacaulis sp. AC460]|uniref:hypothetical protein n=1 Tax=Asticcacaulis sp. AC460 TaxID=1282360 RepID=UPI0003C3F914|nr:hypothetical protein [Asticcacaulis sp. AC460]ESQ93023.1 hypothetical protein ABAC460_01860 [Asticcacaulis sp. AC460]